MKNYFKSIDKYFEGEMSENELIEFEKKMKSNKKLKAEVEFQKELQDSLNDKQIFDLKNNLEKIHNEAKNAQNSETNQEPVVRELFIKKIQLAAAVIIIMIIASSVFYFMNNRTMSNETLYGIYYEPAKTMLVVRSGNNDEVNLMQALQKYNHNDYDGAIEVFEKDNSKMAKFFLALSYMETNRVLDAVNLLKAIIEENDNLFVDQAEWYLGLCYLKLNETEKAIIQFSKISQSNSIYKIKSEEILKNI
ncbi:MAG: tetratricopeptide repeat protein [Bacteroidales bacterium]|nr:tetratricopeptide repeat protein [Bacteroidales bacterium]